MSEKPFVAAECNECSLCCRLMPVDDLDPPKPDVIWCQHAQPGKGGCGIYETRPQSCRDFECMWLQSQRKPDAALPLELRPDLCKVVMYTIEDKLVLKIDPGRPDAYKREPLQSFLKSMMRQGAKVLVGMNGRHFKMHEVVRPR